MAEFKVIIDTTFADFCNDEQVSPKTNKHLRSFINDYEDGKWQIERFDNFIWDNVAETALSKSERDALIGKPGTLLSKAAKNLREVENPDANTEGSELAEILLYGLMKEAYGALPVVPKIFYKQNIKDNAKGADSVHIIVTDDDYTLWFGEAKFFNGIKDPRLYEVVASVKAALQTEKLKKENRVIVDLDYLDRAINNKDVVDEIKLALDSANSIDHIKSKINIPILILHECEITKNHNEANEKYISEIEAHHKDRALSYFKKQISSLSGSVYKYENITFHLILFPVPEKSEIVSRYFKKLKSYKGDV